MDLSDSELTVEGIDCLPIDLLVLLEVFVDLFGPLHHSPLVHSLDHLDFWFADGLEQLLLVLQHMADLFHLIIPSGEQDLQSSDLRFG